MLWQSGVVQCTDLAVCACSDPHPLPLAVCHRTHPTHCPWPFAATALCRLPPPRCTQVSPRRPSQQATSPQSPASRHACQARSRASGRSRQPTKAAAAAAAAPSGQYSRPCHPHPRRLRLRLWRARRPSQAPCLLAGRPTPRCLIQVSSSPGLQGLADCGCPTCVVVWLSLRYVQS